MSRRLLVTVFEREEDILGATNAARVSGYSIADTFTPYAVHGLDRVQGLKPSRLPWVCFGFGLTGAVAKLWYQIWISATSWPVNVGGKPFNSLPAFVPVTFEMMVLFAGIGTVLAFLFRSKLRPGRRPVRLHDRATDNRFILVIEETDAAFDLRVMRELFSPFRPVDMKEQVEPSDGTRPEPAEVR